MQAHFGAALRSLGQPATSPRQKHHLTLLDLFLPRCTHPSQTTDSFSLGHIKLQTKNQWRYEQALEGEATATCKWYS